MSSPGTPSGQGVYSSVPQYEYSDYLKLPEDMGANDGASWDNFQLNLGIATNYGLSLVENNFSVNTTGSSLGMNYLLNTNTLCNAIDIIDACGNPTKVTRYSYIQNNNPNTGIIGSMISDIEKGFNPNNLELAFTPSIDCQKISVYTLDQNNNTGIGTAWVATKEIDAIDACNFSNGINPVNGIKCRESFVNYSDSKYDKYMIYPNKKQKEKDMIESVYLTGLMVFGLYLVYCFMKKNN
jgi:hypothetical protein